MLIKLGRRYDKVIDLVHPISGEKGYFVSESEKEVIDVILADFKNKHLVVTSADGRGVRDE